MSSTIDKPTTPVTPPDRHGPDRLRTVVEMGVCLIVLVVLFRTFLAGGYMIETGSMAPCLAGYHRQAVCPSCRYSFAVEGSQTSVKALCPNCGRNGIAVEDLSRNDGDHLLVYRGAFDFRRPKRWEVVVFRNPNKPTQAYVKRMIALPGEAVQIRDGDVYISGEIQAKSYTVQRGLRIPVYDHDFRPPADDRRWQPRWVIEKPLAGWKETGNSFQYSPPETGNDAVTAWVNYRHWVRFGGSHVTSVRLARRPTAIELPQSGIGSLSYDEKAQLLICHGALSLEIRDRLLAGDPRPDFREALERLYEESHVAAITDGYGYNRGRDGLGQHEVRDLMFSADVRFLDGRGEFVLAITDGTEGFECLFDVKGGKVRLKESSTGRVMRTAPLNESLLRESTRVEISLMDRQVLLAVGGKLAFEPWSYPATDERVSPPQPPVRFGARGMAMQVSSLKLFRDVYYTDDVGRRAIDSPVQLRNNEYFVLGDNSPVSKDSRSWSNGTTLTDDMFLGKPLIVHLPSRRKRIHLGSWQTEIRIPEISRIRYIH